MAAVSVAAPLIREAAAPPLSVAAYRLVLSAAPALALVLWRHPRELRNLSPPDLRALLLSGLCLAGHFATWVASVKYVTIASSVALVTTSPISVAAFALVFARQRTPRGMLLAILVSAGGGLVIGAADLGTGGDELFGDLLALAGAGFAAAFLLLGRSLRARVSLLAYVGVVYPIAAVTLLAAAIAGGQPLLGYPPRTYLALALLALVPQLCGHSALNWTLRYLSAHSVAIAVLAVLLLGEWPGVARVVEGTLIVAGVYLALREETAARWLAPAPQPSA